MKMKSALTSALAVAVAAFALSGLAAEEPKKPAQPAAKSARAQTGDQPGCCGSDHDATMQGHGHDASMEGHGHEGTMPMQGKPSPSGDKPAQRSVKMQGARPSPDAHGH